MEPVNRTGYERVFTDKQLREDMERNLSQAEIARKYGVSPAAISKRLKKLRQVTAMAATAPEESQRFVSRQIDAIGQLTKGLDRVNRLMDACDEWLLEVDEEGNPTGRYDLEPRSGEVSVTYTVEQRTESGFRTAKRKKRLSELLACLEGQDTDGARFTGVEKGEFKHADPRELILKTVQEARSTVHEGVELAKMLADAQAMQGWRQVVLDAIGRAAPDVRDGIIAEIRSSLVLRGLLEQPAAVWSEVN